MTIEPYLGSGAIGACPCGSPARSTTGCLSHDVRSLPSRAGLTIRPVADTARDTLAWLEATPDAVVSGISLDRERQLLDAWHTERTGRGGG